jgi:hypothetical protein
MLATASWVCPSLHWVDFAEVRLSSVAPDRGPHLVRAQGSLDLDVLVQVAA